jgi:hypothetical protein
MGIFTSSVDILVWIGIFVDVFVVNKYGWIPTE